jgi:hypothetical protein
VFINQFIMGIWRQISEYLYIRKRDPNEERNQWMKYMHGINRISILLFLFALLVMLIRAFVRK